MKVLELHAENFKRIRVVDITPGGHVVTIGGENDQGKSSVIDAIWVGIEGKAVKQNGKPVAAKPVRTGAEKAIIKLNLGEVVVTRTFTKAGGDTLKVESADGLRYPRPQEVLDDLLGTIGFDPFAFVNLKADAQAEMLLQLVPLPIDLDEFAALDTSDFDKRRDINREVGTLDGQIAGLPEHTDLPETAPDRDALVAKLGDAANFNTAIDRARQHREFEKERAGRFFGRRDELRARAEQLRQEAATADANADDANAEGVEIEKAIADLPALDEPIDTDAVREQIREADVIEAKFRQKAQRDALVQQRAGKAASSEALTTAMDEREKQRREALAKAKMPIEGLGFAINEKGKPVVTFGGEPFEQASTAQQIKASMAIAMAANPRLRVLRIKDGSLLDDRNMAIIVEMAKEHDYQVFVERVGEGGVGIIMEDGTVKGAPAAEEAPQVEEQPKTKAKATKPADQLL